MLTIVALLGQSGMALAQALPPGDRAVLRWADQELSRGHRKQVLRGLLRALERKPSDAIAQRYADIALPVKVPASGHDREGAKVAAARLLSVLNEQARADLPARNPLGLTLAWALSLTGEHEAARELALRHGDASDEGTVRTLRAMAALALMDERVGDAEALLQLARGFAPTDPELATELGLLLLAAGAAHRALPLLGERFANDLGDLTARRDFAHALLAAGRAREAYEVLHAGGESCVADSTCLLELARTALEASNYQLAMQWAGQLVAKDAGHVDGLFVLAEAQTQHGRAGQARETYERILQLRPNNLRARSALSALGAQLTPGH